MSRKIRYWLVPVWSFALLLLFDELLSSYEMKDFALSIWGFFLIFSPWYLLFIWSYIKGLKIFELPKPSVKDFVLGVLAAVFAIPLLFFISLSVSQSWGRGILEPLSALIFILSFLLDGLIILVIFELRTPRRRCLFMCFLPALLYAAIGIVLILIPGTGFWVHSDYVYASMEELTPIQRQLSVLTAKYFTYFASCFSFVESSFTVYWTMKYNHELSSAPPKGSP